MKRNEIIIAIVMIALGLIAPWVLPSVWTTVVSIFCYYAILTIGWNIIFGYTGLFSYGHVAFPAIGGYTSALLAEHIGLSPFLGLLAGGLAAGFMGVLIGLLILRVRGFYLCLVTWAFAEVVSVVLKAEHHITGGTGGFLAPSFVSGPNAELAGYFIGLGLMALAFVVSALLYHSRWGLYLFAVRDDIDAAESMGVKTRFWKVFGFAFGCAWAGVAGAFYTHYFNLIDPSIGGLDEMGKVCLIVIIGGLGSVYGPVLGSFFVVIVAEFLRGWVGGYSLLIFATIMILAVRFVRGGFMEIIQVISPHLRDKYLTLIGKNQLSADNVPK
jgi:branched-chain amino acid transport system permease protein